VYLEDEEMAVIRFHKGIKVRKIKDDSLVDTYVQELQINLFTSNQKLFKIHIEVDY